MQQSVPSSNDRKQAVVIDLGTEAIAMCDLLQGFFTELGELQSSDKDNQEHP